MLNTERGWRGGENQVFLLATGLSPEFATITACQPDAPLAQRLAGAGAKTLQIRMRGGMSVGAVRAIRRAIRDERIDIVHAHTSHAHTLGLLACWGKNVPLVVTRRVDFPVRGKILSRWKYGARVARFVAISDEIARILAEAGVAPERLKVIRSGIDLRRFDDARANVARREFGFSQDDLVIGCVAHLTAHKDHATLLRAYAAVERAEPRARLLLVGTGELEEQLKRQAADLGLKRVVFAGFRDDIVNILGGLDIFTLSSCLEGLGTIIMDAMCAGLPVVATRAGGIPESITPDKDGLLVGVGDDRALADALIRLCRDGALRRKLGEQARATARARFSHTAMVDQYQQLYRDLLKEQK